MSFPPPPPEGFAPVPHGPEPERLEAQAKTWRIWSTVMWVLFVIVLLGSIAGLQSASRGARGPAEMVGYLIGLVLFVVLPLVLAIVFGARSNRRKQQAADAYQRRADGLE